MKPCNLACAVALLGLVATATACKGETEGGETGEFLEVLETLPEDGATEVPVAGRVGFEASEPIELSTLTSDTVVVTDSEGNSIAATPMGVEENPSAAEILFDEPLAVITDYTVAVKVGLRSTRGATLEEDFEWSFRTLDSEWGVSEWIEEDVFGTSAKQQMAVDGQSNAIAVWEHETSSGTAIWANRYTRTDLWGEPEAIDDGNGGAAAPQIATDGAGNGFAVWERSEDGGFTANIWSNRYDVTAQTWGTPELLQSGEVTNAEQPSVAATPDGDAVATWVQRDDETGNEGVWARSYSASSGWGPAGLIGEPSPTTRLMGTSLLGVDEDGNALAVWSRPTVDGDVIWANRYIPSSGWAEAALIKTDPDTSARRFRLSVGRGGDAFVVWIQGDGMRDDIWAVRFSGSTWGSPEWIDQYDTDDKNDPDIAVDGSGVAHAVWSQSDPDFWNIWSRQYTPGSGWGDPELVEPPNEVPQDDTDAVTPRAAVNSVGNAFVVWIQRWEGWTSVWSNRRDPGGGWVGAEIIEDEARPARAPLIVADEERHAHALWLHFVDDGFDWVRTNRFE